MEPNRSRDLAQDRFTLNGEDRRRAIAAFLEWYAQGEALRALGRATAGYPIEAFAEACRKRTAAKRTETRGYYTNTKPASRGQVRNRRTKT